MESLLSKIASRYFGGLVLLAALAAVAAPRVFLPALGWIKPMLGAIMFGMGMTLAPADFTRVARRPKPVFVGVALQFLVMPAVGFAIAWALGLDPELAAGIVLVGACPGGTASNVIVYLARGDVALSVTMTAVSTLLAPLLTPVLAGWLAGRWMAVSPIALFLSIVKIVLLPVVTGVVFNCFAPEIVRRARPVLPVFSCVLIAIIIAAVVAANRGRLSAAGATTITAVVLHNLAGLGLGWLGALALGLDRERKKAICVEVGMQNSGLAAALATAHLSPLAALPAALFSVWHNISGALLVSIWTGERGSNEE